MGLYQLEKITPENIAGFHIRHQDEGIYSTSTRQSDEIIYQEICKWKTLLTDYQFDEKHAHDSHVWLTCVLALNAVYLGNFGIGSVLAGPDGDVLIQGHNEVFNPYFQSSRHAEMVVMDKFEETHKKIAKLKKYTLYTSLESCPMCLARLITSGVSRVLYAAPDANSGMVHKMEELPRVWLELAIHQNFGQADCSQYLADAAKNIFLLNAGELDEKLKYRSSP